MKRRGKPPAACSGSAPAPTHKAINVPDIKHDGATMCVQVAIVTADDPTAAAAAVNDAIGENGIYLSFVQVIAQGPAPEGLAIQPLPGRQLLVIVVGGVVNTPEPSSAVLERIKAASAQQPGWRGIQVKMANATPEDSRQIWGRFWADIKDEIHRPTQDGQGLWVTPGAPRGKS